MTRAAGFLAWILRMASRACASAAAVTVQVFTTTTSAVAGPGAAVQPRSRSWRSRAAPSACVARQPNCSMWKVVIYAAIARTRIHHRARREHRAEKDRATAAVRRVCGLLMIAASEVCGKPDIRRDLGTAARCLYSLDVAPLQSLPTWLANVITPPR